jgi:hypothetical protein
MRLYRLLIGSLALTLVTVFGASLFRSGYSHGISRTNVPISSMAKLARVL